MCVLRFPPTATSIEGELSTLSGEVARLSTPEEGDSKIVLLCVYSVYIICSALVIHGYSEVVGEILYSTGKNYKKYQPVFAETCDTH